MKKSIIASLLVAVVLVSCLGITAAAKSQTIRYTTRYGYTVGTWRYDVSLLSGNYYSYYDDDSGFCDWYHCCFGGKDHSSWVKNNKTGNSSGWVLGKCGRESKATVKASWSGGGSASYNIWW